MNLSARALSRIAAGRRRVVKEARRVLSALAPSAAPTESVPAILVLASELFDREAREWIRVATAASLYGSVLTALEERITEAILPDLSLRDARAAPSGKANISTEYDLATKAVWEVDPDGARRPARPAIQTLYAANGLWEELTAPHCWHWAHRHGNAYLREALRQTLYRRRVHWVGQYAAWAGSAAEDGTTEEPTLTPSPASVSAADSIATPRAQVAAFIERLWREKQSHITRLDICIVAGYKDNTTIMRYQRGEGTVRSRKRLAEVLALAPVDFLRRLKEVRSARRKKSV